MSAICIRNKNWSGSMRNKLVLLLIVCQFLVLGFMAGKREYIHATGTEIYLQTAPIDPRDPFRGDFVRLRYPLSTVNPQQFRGSVEQHRTQKDYPVYAVLMAGADSIYTLDHLTDTKPEQGVFLKGFLANHDWRWFVRGQNLAVRYGIEQYFVQQGAGMEMENMLGNRNELQRPLEMHIAIGTDGTAVIKGHRWSKLAGKLEILRSNPLRFNNATNQMERQPGPLSPKIKFTVQNASDRPVTLVDPGQHCGFVLSSVEWAVEDYSAADSSCDSIALSADALFTLQPQQTYQVEFDLSEARWHVQYQGKAQEIGAIPGTEMFRIVYRAPQAAALASLANTESIWLGELASQAFNATGQID
jgi:uncharacterized membrane-anchored protein